MKKLLTLLALCIAWHCQAQIVNPKEVVKRKSTDRTNSIIDRTIDKGLDKMEDGIGSVFKKKDKPEEKSKNKEVSESSDSESLDRESTERQEAKTQSSPVVNKSSNEAIKPTFNANSKFDFVPGEKLIAMEDFSQDAVGDFPAKWNTNSGGEIVTIDGQEGHWLQFAKEGIYYPEFVNELPENFTMEYDMMISDDLSNNYSGLMVYFPQVSERKLSFDFLFHYNAYSAFDLHPVPDGSGSVGYIWQVDTEGEKMFENQKDLQWEKGKSNHVAIWKQKSRLRVYLNENKVWDIPKAFDSNLKYSMLFATRIWEGNLYMSNLKVAIGAPDTRSKLITEGRFSTTGILFDVNSDRIKPSSEGTLKEIAKVLTENPTVKIKIIGHTDADGADAANQTLSEKRAASVKKTLSNDFGIAADRMITEGKGESQPVDKNDTPQGKANNRRVEFVKL